MEKAHQCTYRHVCVYVCTYERLWMQRKGNLCEHVRQPLQVDILVALGSANWVSTGRARAVLPKLLTTFVKPASSCTLHQHISLCVCVFG